MTAIQRKLMCWWIHQLPADLALCEAMAGVDEEAMGGAHTKHGLMMTCPPVHPDTGALQLLVRDSRPGRAHHADTQ